MAPNGSNAHNGGYLDFEQKIADLEREGKAIEVGDKHKLSQLQSQISSNPAVKDFMAAQVDYMNLMRKVNEAVMKQLAPADKGEDK